MRRGRALGMKGSKMLVRKALKVQQKGGRFIYLLSLKGDELLQIAGVSRISRDDKGKLIGYQRAEVRRHVQAICEYLEGDDMILAHPLVLSFGSNVRFASSRGAGTSDGQAVAGKLFIPLPGDSAEKPAWIVDGQQRAFAIRGCKDKSFAVPICAFISDDVEIQRDQFVRINTSKPLPRGLVTELLPEVSSPLPANLAIKKVPSILCDLLNRQDGSPFKGLILRASTPKAERQKAVVTDTVVVKMIEESLTQATGCLFAYRNIASGEYDHEGIWAVLVTFWSAVRDTFPDAWGKPSRESRLMHGVGMRAMGRGMDRMMFTCDARKKEAISNVRQELAAIAPLCRWTSGEWEDLEGIKWNELQNLHKHLSMLSNYLIRAHKLKSVEAFGR